MATEGSFDQGCLDDLLPLPGWLSRNLKLLFDLERRAAGIGFQLDRRKKSFLKLLKESKRKHRKSSGRSRRSKPARRYSAVDSKELEEILNLQKKQRALYREKLEITLLCCSLVDKSSESLEHVLRLSKRDRRGEERRSLAAEAGASGGWWREHPITGASSGGAAPVSELLPHAGSAERKSSALGGALGEVIVGPAEVAAEVGGAAEDVLMTDASCLSGDPLSVSGSSRLKLRVTKSSTAVVGHSRLSGVIKRPKSQSAVGCESVPPRRLSCSAIGQLGGHDDESGGGGRVGESGSGLIAANTAGTAVRHPLRITLSAQRNSCGRGLAIGDRTLPDADRAWRGRIAEQFREAGGVERSVVSPGLHDLRHHSHVEMPSAEVVKPELGVNGVGSTEAKTGEVTGAFEVFSAVDAEGGHVAAAAGGEVYCCPVCGEGEKELMMVACDSCDRWFHCDCVGFVETPGQEGDWYCMSCTKEHFNE